jgi:hypothetical protein
MFDFESAHPVYFRVAASSTFFKTISKEIEISVGETTEAGLLKIGSTR